MRKQIIELPKPICKSHWNWTKKWFGSRFYWLNQKW